MYQLHKVDAVHDILQRVIKSDLNGTDLVELVDELKLHGYEEDNIHITVTDTIYEEGDEIVITKEMYDALPTTEYIEANWKKVSPKERYQNDARKTINYGYGNEPKFPIRGTLEALRISNDRGQMVVNWQDTTSPGDCWKQTNCYWLEYMGFKIKEPVFKVIPIVEADDNLLNTDDLIIKYLMIDNNWSEEQAENHIKPVYEAMRKAEAVFYQP